ncbi:hypothetical protein QJS04_geneDACA001224 [Acorus gramineus]|uniref:Uncharacterized protein n=1 Tax=Acorus gramineus TaxID=55184 RepID=A0AAV9AF47_ACOGR|nr:hypothetical protein QJS04_geneDACA001224 [Acorus gramineus]
MALAHEITHDLDELHCDLSNILLVHGSHRSDNDPMSPLATENPCHCCNKL